MAKAFEIIASWQTSAGSQSCRTQVELTATGQFEAKLSFPASVAPPTVLAISGFPCPSISTIRQISADALPAGKAVVSVARVTVAAEKVSNGRLIDLGGDFQQFLFIASGDKAGFQCRLPELGAVDRLEITLRGMFKSIEFSELAASVENLADFLLPVTSVLREANDRLDALSNQNIQISDEYVKLCADARDRLYAFQARDKELNEIYASTSWRLTRPVRWLKSRVGGLKRHLSTSNSVTEEVTVVVPVSRTPVVVVEATTAPASLVSSAPSSSQIIDVIVPVYRGIEETRRCIEAALAHKQRTPYEVIVVNDCSPDPEVTEYARQMGASGAVTLIENPVNLGFAGAVTRGMEVHPDRDIVLLNADTVVNSDWLDRMLACARSEERIGTVTPYSNNATVCSYPKISVPNELPEGTTGAQLDELFKRLNSGIYIQIPTGVGFCMYINREAMVAAGGFDSSKFSAGYGEENDFCLRADSVGWKNMLCADTFVYHEGAVSFQEKEERLKQHATAKILQIFPDYNDRVTKYLQSDPGAKCRYAVDFERIRMSGKPALLFVLHGSGGGTEQHVQELAKLYKDQFNIFCLKAVTKEYVCNARLWWINPGEVLGMPFMLPADYNELLQVLEALDVRRIHYHHLLGHDKSVRNLPQDIGVPFDFTVHDYYTTCAQLHLLDWSGEYCSEPDEAGCNRCIRMQPTQSGFAGTISEWRESQAWLVQDAARVIAPSADVAARIKKYFPLSSPIVASHPDISEVQRLASVKPQSLRADEPLRVVVLGAMSQGKGADVLEACAIDAMRRGLNIDFHLIGYAYRKLRTLPKSRLTVHGEFEAEELASFFSLIKPHLVWFPARGPETYSYTLSSCLKLGVPVVATDIGAFPERLKQRDWTWLMPWKTTAQDWNDFFCSLVRDHFAPGIGLNVEPVKSALANFYEVEYLSWYQNRGADPPRVPVAASKS